MTEPAPSPHSPLLSFPLPLYAKEDEVFDANDSVIAACFHEDYAADLVLAVNAHGTLTAERDEARRELVEANAAIDDAEPEACALEDKLRAAESARDAALAEAAALREALVEISDAGSAHGMPAADMVEAMRDTAKAAIEGRS